MKDESATENLESVKRRVKKLLALSKSPCEAEAESAMRKANELMAAYKISQKEISDFISKSVKGTKRVSRWRTILANAVENVYATCHYRTPEGKLIFYGEELDVFMATETVRLPLQDYRPNGEAEHPQERKIQISTVIPHRNSRPTMAQNVPSRLELLVAQARRTGCPKKSRAGIRQHDGQTGNTAYEKESGKFNSLQPWQNRCRRCEPCPADDRKRHKTNRGLVIL